MNYYLTYIDYIVSFEGKEEKSRLTQLVMASDKEKARDAIEKNFNEHIESSLPMKITLLKTRVQDTIIGE